MSIIKTTDGGGQPIGITPISNNVPTEFNLYQNYPNPFNPKTKIKFSLPSPSKGGVYSVRLLIYDILGKEVAQLFPLRQLAEGQEGLQPGIYEAEWDATNYPSGVYLYKLVVGENTNNGVVYSETKRMVLIK